MLSVFQVFIDFAVIIKKIFAKFCYEINNS